MVYAQRDLRRDLHPGAAQFAVTDRLVGVTSEDQATVDLGGKPQRRSRA